LVNKNNIFLEISLQSPLQSSAPIKSPFVGPSPNANPQYNYNQNKEAAGEDSKTSGQKQSSFGQSSANVQHMTSGSTTSALLLNQHQYKKCHSASIPIYLSENGFLQMLTVKPETNHSPLETFLASFHLKKKLIKAFQNDSIAVSFIFK
jgi:hypothetical protein